MGRAESGKASVIGVKEEGCWERVAKQVTYKSEQKLRVNVIFFVKSTSNSEIIIK